MRSIWHNFYGAFRRIFPDCMTQAQAVAFNMFLSFIPMLLFAFGVLSSSPRLSEGVEEMIEGLRWILPPGSRSLILDNLGRKGTDPWKWILLGLWGTLLVGTQVMQGLMEGFRIVYRGRERRGYWRRQRSALLLLCVTIGPFLASVLLTVFGKQVRAWMIAHFGLPGFFHGLWVVVYGGLALIMGVLVQALIYRAGRTVRTGWNEVLPGAVVATLLWWVVNTSFGLYVQHVPYSPVYGGLAAVIGLMVWMNLSVVVVFIGAAYNAEASDTAAATAAAPVSPEPVAQAAAKPSG